MPEKRRLYKSMMLPGGRRVLELRRDNSDEGDGHVFHAVTSAAPGAAPARMDGATRVDVTMTVQGQGRAGEEVAGRGANEFILRLRKGVLKQKKIVIDNHVPVCRTHYAIWNQNPLPLEREVLDPNDEEQLFRPTPEEEDWLAFECNDYRDAVVCAGARLEHFRRANGLVGAQGTRVKQNTGPGNLYVTITNPDERLPHVCARFYYDGAQPPERNPLDAVLGQRQPTQAEAFVVCETGAQALAAMNALLSEPVVWRTTVATAMAFCCERSVSELPPATREGTRIWSPPPFAAVAPA